MQHNAVQGPSLMVTCNILPHGGQKSLHGTGHQGSEVKVPFYNGRLSCKTGGLRASAKAKGQKFLEISEKEPTFVEILTLPSFTKGHMHTELVTSTTQ